MIGVVGLVTGQLSKFDNFFISKAVIHNKEVVWFANEGSDKVLEFTYFAGNTFAFTSPKPILNPSFSQCPRMIIES